MLSQGWRAIQEVFRSSLKEKPEDEDAEGVLPALTEGQVFEPVSASVTEHFTSPPKPYTEDTLLSAMENAGKEDMPDEAERKGLGTPATRAAIIEKLVSGGFVERKGKNLIPTKAGVNLVTVLPELLTSPKLTADWEQRLNEVAKGQASPEDFMDGIEAMAAELVRKYEEFLDVDPQAIREAIENPDQSHVDEMLSFAEQANREYEAELYRQQAVPTPDDRETGETVRTPRGTFHVTDMSREQMEAAGYGFHHESEDGKYLIMANGSRAFAIPSGAAPEHAAPEKMTVLVVEPMKEPYVKEIDPGLHALQAEVGGDIAASYPFDDPVGLVLNDEGKLIGLDLNRSLRDEHGEIYDIVAGTFLVVGLGPESFASLPPDMIQKYTEQFKRPELFASINGQIVSVPVEPENPLRTAEMTLEDDYGMIDGIINNGRRGEELEKAQTEARRTTPEKKPSIRERLEDAKRECAERKSPDKPAPQKKPPELGDL